jgi:hypothetical protein
LTVTVLFALIGIVELSVAVLGALLACVLGEPAIVAVDRLVSGRAALEVLGTGGDDGQEGSETSEYEDVHSSAKKPIVRRTERGAMWWMDGLGY